MKNKVVATISLLAILSSNSFADCSSLMSKYNAPDPSVKTMKQLKRWVKRKIKTSEKGDIEKCLVDRAADNPNKSTVAGQ